VLSSSVLFIIIYTKVLRLGKILAAREHYVHLFLHALSLACVLHKRIEIYASSLRIALADPLRVWHRIVPQAHERSSSELIHRPLELTFLIIINPVAMITLERLQSYLLLGRRVKLHDGDNLGQRNGILQLIL
jgi:hypothetical protein